MSDSTAESSGVPGRAERDWLSGGVVGFAAGVGLCAAFGIFLTLLAWKNHEPGQAETGAPRTVASVPGLAANLTLAVEAGRPLITATKPETKPLEPAQKAHSALAVGIDSAPEKSEAPVIERSPGPPVVAASTGRVVSADADPFKLSQPPVSIPAPFVLPQKPWFALEDLAPGEPESCPGTQAVCAVNRSLNTALSWARSPAEAAERAKRDGKLVFLIHVSGNFEDPGFT